MSTPRLIGFSAILLSLACPADDGAADPTSTSGATNPTGGDGGTAMDGGPAGGTADDAADNMDTAGDEPDEGPDSGDDNNDDGNSEDGCCERHSGGGCNEPAVATCVCDMDPSCCTFEWDDSCVDTARNTCDATCQAADDDGDGDTMGDDAGSSGGVMDTGGGSSGAMDEGNLTETGPMDEGGGEPSECCMTSETPGCGDAEIEMCVCVDNEDPFCCEMAWDFQCVSETDELCGGMCVPMAGDEDCCVPHATTGCDDMAVEDCVCEFDPFCCNEAWDDQCVAEAEDPCMAAC